MIDLAAKLCGAPPRLDSTPKTATSTENTYESADKLRQLLADLRRNVEPLPLPFSERAAVMDQLDALDHLSWPQELENRVPRLEMEIRHYATVYSQITALKDTLEEVRHRVDPPVWRKILSILGNIFTIFQIAQWVRVSRIRQNLAVAGQCLDSHLKYYQHVSDLVLSQLNSSSKLGNVTAQDIINAQHILASIWQNSSRKADTTRQVARLRGRVEPNSAEIDFAEKFTKNTKQASADAGCHGPSVSFSNYALSVRKNRGRLKSAIPDTMGKARPTTITYDSAPGDDGANNRTGIAYATGLRPRMEDAHLSARMPVRVGGKIVEAKLHGVFDGHGAHGARCSAFARDRVGQRIRERLSEFCAERITDEGIYNALKLAMVDVNDALSDKAIGRHSGTTANISLILGDVLYIVNVGDSRAIFVNGLSNPKNGFSLSKDHKPRSDIASIEKRGGIIDAPHGTVRAGHRTVGAQLALSRALGDAAHFDAISPRPTLTRVPLTDLADGGFLVHVCDGLTDVLTTSRICDVVREQTRDGKSPTEIAATLVNLAYAKGSGDNLTAMVIPVFPPAANTGTSTQQASRSAASV